MGKYIDQVKKYEDYVIGLRRELHRHPELSGQEIWTSQRICSELDALGIPHTRVNELNVVGLIDTGRLGKTIAIRADIDALPVQEQADVEFKSEIDGKMHACGHDSHTAMLLGAAKILKENEASFGGKIYLCFQIGEETGIGAKEIVQYLKEQGGVDHVFGQHIASILPKGYIGLAAGPIMAGSLVWSLEIQGKGGHGSMPALSIDPIKPASEIVLRYTSLMVNRIDPLTPVVVSPCMFHAGSAANIIPQNTRIDGTIRYFDESALDTAIKCMAEIADNVAASYGAKAVLNISSDRSVPVVNDAAAVEVAIAAAGAVDGLEVVNGPKLMGSDNFSEFVNAFPGFYAWVGAQNSEIGANMPHHHPQFKLDESAFVLGTEFLVECAMRFLGAE